MDNWNISKWASALLYGDYESLLLAITNKPPNRVSVLFTRKCNLSCIHCMYDHKDDSIVNYTMIEKSLEFLVNSGIRDVVHAGRIVKKCQIPILQNLQSQGVALSLNDNGSIVRIFKDILKHGIYFENGIKLSIDGPKNIHEVIRGKKSWNDIEKMLENSNYFTSKVILGFTISQFNSEFIIQFLKTAMEFSSKYRNIEKIIFSPVFQSNYQSHKTELSEVEFLEFVGTLASQNYNILPVELFLYEDWHFETLIRNGLLTNFKFRYETVEADYNNISVCYFPASIAPSYGYIIDSDGALIFPYYMHFKTNNRPINSYILLEQLDKNKRLYLNALDIYGKLYGEKKFMSEKSILSSVLSRHVNSISISA